MPQKDPTVSFTLLRNYTERFRWKDPVNEQEQTGFNPPAGAENVSRVPFFIRYVTATGKVESGNVTCIAVDPDRLQRKIKYVNSGEIRIVYDYLVVEVDGTRFVSH